jgi:hypothetical protein
MAVAKHAGPARMSAEARSVGRFACADGPRGEAEHVGALGVFGAAAALVGRELAVWIDLALEALEELLAGRAGAGAPVFGAAP